MNGLVTSSVAIVLCCTASGCREHVEAPPLSAADQAESITAWPATRKTDRENFSVSVKPIDIAIERNRHLSLEVAIAETATPPSGQELEVKVDADMPSHRHGMNTRPEITKTGEGRYRVDGMLFHMGGDWVITVIVTGKAGPEQAEFPVFIE